MEWRDGPLPRVRTVRWTHQVLRDALSVDTRNGLGSIATFFRASQDTSDELWAKAVPLDAAGAEAPPPLAVKVIQDDAGQTAETILREEVREKAEQFIEDRIASLDWQQMQELVAGILGRWGTTRLLQPTVPTEVSTFLPRLTGSACRSPRIFVEVKHRSGAMGADALRSFLGGRRAGDRCLHVSAGGFTKEARYEADRANIPLTLVTLPKLRELLLQHYERLDPAARALVPLQRLYWPVE